jgi:hypothetical protein
MKTRSLLAASAMLLAALSAGAIAAEEAIVEADAAARLFQPVPGKAVVYLIRDFGNLWVGHVKVTLDGRDMGVTYHNTYMRWEVAPGEHTLVSHTSPPAALIIRTEPGGLYYVWQDINQGFQRAPSALRVVDQTTTRSTLNTARMLKSPQ